MALTSATSRRQPSSCVRGGRQQQRQRRGRGRWGEREAGDAAWRGGATHVVRWEPLAALQLHQELLAPRTRLPSDAAPHRHLALLSHLRRSHTRRRCFRHSPPPAPPPPRARRWRVGEERCGSGASAAASFRTPSARRASRWLANAPRSARWHRAHGARCGDDALARRTLRPRADARREVAGGSRFLEAAKTEVLKERVFRAADRNAKRRGSPRRLVGHVGARTSRIGRLPRKSSGGDGHGHPPYPEGRDLRVS